MFSIFSQLWVLAFFLHHSEDWKPASVVVSGMFLMAWIHQAKDKSFPFFVSLLIFFGYSFEKSPHLANHSNYYMLICFCLLLWMLGVWIKEKDLNQEALSKTFINMRPVLCLSLFVVYWMAGFHKLNAGFFNPEVSCASDFFLRYAREYKFSQDYIPDLFINYSPHLVTVVELVGAALLLFARTQIYGVLSFVGLHSYLIPLSFYDFASICYSILLCFLPAQIFVGSENMARLQKGVTALFASCLAGSLLARFMIDNDWDRIWIYSDVAQGWFFLAGSAYLFWQMYLNIQNEKLSVWSLPGVHLFRWQTVSPRWMYVMPVLLLIYTNTSYLGLRTAGNTTMFSNLRTEGGVSNHFLMSSDWQLFDYQKDLIEVESVPTSYSRWIRNQPKEGMMMTTFELRRIVGMWKEDGDIVPMSFRSNGELTIYDDIVASKEWGENPLPWLAKKLMLFREVQPEGPNECRW